MPFGIPSEDFHGGFGLPHDEDDYDPYTGKYAFCGPEKKTKMTIEVNYDEASALSAALCVFMRTIYTPEGYPDADMDYLIGQIQDAMEELE